MQNRDTLTNFHFEMYNRSYWTGQLLLFCCMFDKRRGEENWENEGILKEGLEGGAVNWPYDSPGGGGLQFPC